MNKNIVIISIHWGMSLGGVGKYATYINDVERYAPVKIKSVCILGYDWKIDESCLERLGAYKIFIKSRLDVSWVPKIRVYIDREKPDAILVHGFNGYFVSALHKYLYRNKVPLICTYHGHYHAATFSRKFVAGVYNQFAEYFMKHIATSVVCVSEHSRRYLINKGVSPDKITLIHNGIEDFKLLQSNRGSTRAEWGVTADEILVGCVSRLDPVKGIQYLITAVSSIKNNIANVKLVIIGRGPIEDKLKRKVKELGIESLVIFAGFRSDIAQCLEAFDIFVLPSISENHSIALLEAMRAGKPIIATDVGGNTESVRHMREGVIVPSADSGAIADAIKLLSTDHPLRESLGAAARKRFLARFTIEQMVRSTAEWLVNVVDKGAA